MTNKTDYRPTVRACYGSNVIQAVVINLTPLLFLILKNQFDLTYSQFGMLTLANFCTQVAADVGFARGVEKHGFRPYLLVSHVLCTAGFLLFALAPDIFPEEPFAGFLLGTILFSGSGGLMELLLSPIIAAIPSENSAKSMSLLHSVYAWGKLGCIILTTLAVMAGLGWKTIVILWTLLPVAGIFPYFRVPMPDKIPEHQRMPSGKMLLHPMFVMCFFAIVLGGASEVTISQWTTTYLQMGLGIPRIWANLLGMGGFALMLGIGRTVHGIWGHKIPLPLLLAVGCLCACGCYLTIALAPHPALGILGCIGAGFCVSILWPGTVTLAHGYLPTAGASMFALLAAGGDIGGSAGPWLVGNIADTAIARGLTDPQALRVAMACAAAFPFAAFLIHNRMKHMARREGDLEKQ